MTPAAPALLEVQRAMRASLIAHQDAEVSSHVLDAGVPSAERLDVYRNTFISVLTTALRLSHPVVHRLVGADFFEAAARIFMVEQPPVGACLDDYGSGFAEFFATFPHAASLAYLPDVARLEWAVNRALHADDTTALDARHLSHLSTAAQAGVSFTPHPSISLLRSDFPVDQIWRAVLDNDDEALAAIDLSSGPIWLLVERADLSVEVHRLSEAAWRFSAALFSGRPLVAAIEEARFDAAPEVLAEHLAAGRFISFELADSSDQPFTTESS